MAMEKKSNRFFDNSKKNKSISQLNDKYNIVITGKTGVGKSVLINKIIGAELTKTGIGRSITQEMKEICRVGSPFRIYDTVGLELDRKRQNQAEKDIVKKIREKQSDPDKAIHCILYCINANSNRIEDEEIEVINELSEKFKNVLILVIITQAYDSKRSMKLKRIIDADIFAKKLKASKSFCVLASDFVVDENYRIKAYGVDELQNYLTNKFSEAFASAKNVASLKKKRERAQAVIAATVAGAFAAGYSPIPFSDAFVLVGIQIGMIASITPIYGADIKKSTISAIITTMLGTTGATIAGKTIVANLLKFVPFAGEAVGGTISGTTAATLTAAMGETYILIMEKLIKGEISEQDLENKDKVKQFKAEFIKNLKHVKIENLKNKRKNSG